MHATFEHLFYGLILLVAGLGCGLVNTLASSGSAISVPVLLMFGLSPLDANATNRLTAFRFADGLTHIPGEGTGWSGAPDSRCVFRPR
jgi:hypothetical protein